MKVRGNKGVLSFEYGEEGLMRGENGGVKGFVVGGGEGGLYGGVGVIKGRGVEVWGGEVGEGRGEGGGVEGEGEDIGGGREVLGWGEGGG